jgi:hypothetical protein
MSGNVGIGTTTPKANLHIWKSLGSKSTFLKLQNAADAEIDIDFINATADTTTARIGSIRHNTPVGGNTDMAFSTYNSSVLTEWLRIKNNGNVGIGTTSPAGKLTVATAA